MNRVYVSNPDRQAQIERQAQIAQQAIRDRDARRALRAMRAQLETLAVDEQRAFLVRSGNPELVESLDQSTPFQLPQEQTDSAQLPRG